MFDGSTSGLSQKLCRIYLNWFVKTIYLWVAAAAYGKHLDDEYTPRSCEYGDVSHYLEDGKLLNIYSLRK